MERTRKGETYPSVSGPEAGKAGLLVRQVSSLPHHFASELGMKRKKQVHKNKKSIKLS